MNYLAHAYLSGDNIPLSVGNFIADFVKGKNYLSYPDKIIKGIFFHRLIDDYTDKHWIFKKNVSKLFPKYRHYSRVIIDMYYDHFLAANWNRFHHTSLSDYSRNFSKNMLSFQSFLPSKVYDFLKNLETENWFVSYSSIDGMKNILVKMDSRTSFESNMHDSVDDLKKDYNSFKKDFFAFFEDIKYYSEKQIKLIDKKFALNT